MKIPLRQRTLGALAAIAMACLCGNARADLSISNSTTTTSWNQVNGNNPFYVSMPSANMTGFTGQGQPGAGTGASNTVLCETFTITNGAGSLANGNTNYVLTSIAIVASSEPAGSSLHIYDVTTTLTSNNGSPLNGSGATYNFVTNGDLLGNGNGLTFTNTLSAANQVLYSFSSGPNTRDQIVLGAGHTYAFEIWTPTSSTGFVWDRNSVADAGGQAMGSHDASLSVARLTIASLGLAGGAPRTFTLALYGAATSAALSVNTNLTTTPQTNYWVDQFNSYGFGPTNHYVGTNDYNLGQITNVWSNWFGNALSSLTWDPSSDANNNANSGSMKIVANFSSGGQFAVYDGANGITPPLSGYYQGLSSLQFDVRFDPSSPTTINSGTGSTNYGHLQYGIRSGTGQDFFGSLEVGVGTTNWVHVNAPISINTDSNLLAINDVVIKIDGGWYSSNPLNGTSTLWVDNIQFVGPVNFVPPPAPTLGMHKAIPGLRMFAGSTANTYDRVELATTDENQSWIGGTYPVSYSFTLLDYPANINQTHIFLVPVSTSGQNNLGNGAGSVNEFIEYQATNALWLDINPGATAGSVTASVMWKTNFPNNNPNQTALIITNPTAVGTWTLSFTGPNAGTVTAPGASAVPFTITNATVSTDFANPLVAYFGLQPNSSQGIGQFEDWGSIKVAGVQGANESEDFTSETTFNPNGYWSINTLTVALNSCVQLASTNTPFWVTWTSPAVLFSLGESAQVNAPSANWFTPQYYNNYTDTPVTALQGTTNWTLIPMDCLPSPDGSQTSGNGNISPTGFFKMMNPPPAQ